MGAAITSLITGAGSVAAVTAMATETQLIAIATLGIFGGIWAVKKIKHALI